MTSAFYWLKQSTVANGHCWSTLSTQLCDKMNVLLKHLFKKNESKTGLRKATMQNKEQEQRLPRTTKGHCVYLHLFIIFWWSCNAENKTCSDAMYIDIVIMFYVLIKSIFNLWYFKIASAVIVQYSWHSAQCV